jgi:hypothetical protein
MRRWGSLLLVILMCGLAPPVSANEPRVFTACGSSSEGGACRPRVNVGYGETVYFEGEVTPPHADLRAGVWHKPIGGRNWNRWDTVPIADDGTMEYALNTGRLRIQNYAELVEFRIKGHGESNRVRVYIWAGE